MHNMLLDTYSSPIALKLTKFSRFKSLYQLAALRKEFGSEVKFQFSSILVQNFVFFRVLLLKILSFCVFDNKDFSLGGGLIFMTHFSHFLGILSKKEQNFAFWGEILNGKPNDIV